MKVCAIIVTYGDRFHLLKQVIDSCFNEYVCKVIVVDNASNETSRNQLKLYEKLNKNRLKVIYLHKNIGSAGGYRVGLEEAYKSCSCEFILLLDDDNKLEPGSLKKYIDYYNQLSKRSKCVLAGFRYSRPHYVEALSFCNGEFLLEPKNSFVGFHMFYCWKKILRKILPGKKKACSIIDTPIAPFGGLFFKKEILDIIGFPNREYFVYEDDTEFTYRITQAGYTIYLIPDIRIIDLDEYWCKQDGSQKGHPYFTKDRLRFYYFIRNKLYFQKKYRIDNKLIFSINKSIYFIRMLFLSVLYKDMGRFHLFRRAVYDAIAGNMGKKRYKILFISHVLDRSGAPRSLWFLLKHMSKRKDIDIYLLGLRRDDLETEFSKILTNPPIVITKNPPKNKYLKLVERIITIPKIFSYIWKINPDLVFINSAANSRAILISKVLGYKTYVFVREFEEGFVSLSNLRKRFINLADKVFVTNEIQEIWLRKKLKYKGKIIVIPNGIDFEELRDLITEEPEDRFLKFTSNYNFIIANIGYMSFRKGWDYFSEIIKRLKEYKDIGFVIIGDFINENEKKKFISRLEKEGLLERVFITGLTNNIYKYMKYVDVIAITSRSETFSRVALESMAIGRPVVFFDVGGIKLLFPENYKYKVRPFDIRRYVSCLLEIYYMDRTSLENLKNKLREKTNEFDIKILSNKFYKALVSDM